MNALSTVALISSTCLVAVAAAILRSAHRLSAAVARDLADAWDAVDLPQPEKWN
jgi:hypothetical protein